jgi:hypothetical protein
MDPVVAVQTALLRNVMPEVTLREGASIVARVASRGERHGVLVLAGVPLTAQLPAEVQAGATLRLKVHEVGAERVVLRIEQGPDAAAPVPFVPPEASRGSTAPRVEVQEPPRRRGGGGEGTASVALSFQSSALGRLDLRIDLAAGTVSATVEAPRGQALELAEDGADRLRDGLAARTGLAAEVRVQPRRDPLDLYA